jgi:hypothetical protein
MERSGMNFQKFFFSACSFGSFLAPGKEHNYKKEKMDLGEKLIYHSSQQLS